METNASHEERITARGTGTNHGAATRPVSFSPWTRPYATTRTASSAACRHSSGPTTPARNRLRASGTPLVSRRAKGGIPAGMDDRKGMESRTENKHRKRTELSGDWKITKLLSTALLPQNQPNLSRRVGASTLWSLKPRPDVFLQGDRYGTGGDGAAGGWWWSWK